jgi:membrane fusion protein (multidrug efflux system)
MKLRFAGGNFFFLVLFIFMLSTCKNKKTETIVSGNTPRATEVKAMVVVPRLLENKIYTTGSILANEEVEIRAELAGRITAIQFQEGTMVSKGDVLVTINDSELQAELKKLLLDEKLAQDDVFRKEKLIEMKAVSQEELDIARGKLGVIGADIELIRSKLEKTKIYAPFTGRIGLRHVSPGGYISSSNLIARIQQIDPVKLEFSVPEKYLSSIRSGLEVLFTVAGYDSTFSGTVYALESRIDPSTRSFSARARCTNPGSALVPGAFAKVSIILEKINDAVVLPSDALIPDIRGEKVFLCQNGKAVSRYITTGIRTETDVQVIEGLQPSDTVIISGLLSIREQMSVIPRIPGTK